MIQKIFNELEASSKARIGQLLKARAEGTPLVGYNTVFIPEELIRACGANTYFICRGGEPEPPEAVFDGMLRFMNPLSRSLAGFAVLNLDPIRTSADMLVVAQTDTHYGRISEYMEYNGYNIAKVGVPGDWKRGIAVGYYEKSMRKLIAKVEKLTGKLFDAELAKKYVEQSNRINGYMRRINELRKKMYTPIGFVEFLRLNHLSLITAADFFEEKIAQLCEELEKCSVSRSDEKTPRILVAGRAFAIGDYIVPRTVESNGAVIVAEMMDEGMRAYEIDVATEGNLFANYAKNRYLDRVPINLFQPSWEERFENVKNLVAECTVDAVVWYQLAFDEIYDMEYSCMAKWLNQIGVPILRIDSAYTYSREETGPMSTRIESFIESLKA